MDIAGRPNCAGSLSNNVTGVSDTGKPLKCGRGVWSSVYKNCLERGIRREEKIDANS